MKDIYKLELNECVTILDGDGVFPHMEVMRVPGGWICSTGPYLTPVLVPFSNEFNHTCRYLIEVTAMNSKRVDMRIVDEDKNVEKWVKHFNDEYEGFTVTVVPIPGIK